MKFQYVRAKLLRGKKLTVDTYKLTKLDKSPIWSLIYPFKPWLPRSLKDKNSKNQEGYTCAGLVITRFNQQKVKGYLLRKKRSVSFLL